MVEEKKGRVTPGSTKSGSCKQSGTFDNSPKLVDEQTAVELSGGECVSVPKFVAVD